MARTEVTGSQIKDQSVDLTVDVTNILPVGNGGTGSNTLPLNNVLIGNGTGALQAIAPGTAGNVLRSNGSAWASTALTKSDVGLANVDNTSDATKNSATATLTNKTLSAPVLSGTVTGTYTLGGTPTFPATVVQTTSTQTLTNKTISGASNTLSAIPQAAVNGLVTGLSKGSNVATNPGFQNTSLYLGQATYSTEFARSGTHSAKIVGTGSGQWAYLSTTDTTVLRQAVAPGDVIYMECWIYGDGNTLTSGSFSLYAQGYDGAGANVENLAAATIAASPALNGVWTKFSGYRKMTNADIRTVALGVYTTAAAGEVYYLDDPVVRFVTDAAEINQVLFGTNNPGTTVLQSALPSTVVTTTGTQALTNKNLAGAGNTFPTFNQSTTGNAATATALQTARTINGVSFDGTANITVADATKEPVITAGTTAQYWRGDKSWQTLNSTAVGLGNVNNTSDAAKPVSTATQTALNLKEDTANKGVANGYASLDTNGKVPGSQLPNSIMTYQGLHNASTNSPTLTDAGGAAGQVYRISVAGTRNYGSGNIELAVGDYLIHNGTAWEKADTTDAVSTVNGYTGNITLTKADVGLGSVDNTADAAKNVLSATKLTTARTINGVSFDGTANITVADATKLPLTGGTVTGMTAFYTSGVTSDDWQNSPISIRERGLVTNTQLGNAYAPNLNFHWANRASLSLWMDSNGVLNWGNYGGTGTPATDGTLNVGALTIGGVTVPTISSTSTLTNKTISGSSNTLSNIPQSAVTSLTTDLAAKEPTITAGTTAQYWRGDKSWQTLDKTAVGLGSVDNTADAAKNVLSATKLTTARTINGVSFDGTANITVPIGVTATQGGVIYGDSTTSYASTAAGTAGQLLASGGTGVPTWVPNDLTAFPSSAFKKAAKVATTANITLSGTQTIDGIAVVAGDRVLVKDQTTSSANGVYVVAAGAWTRTTDCDTADEIAGALIPVDQGTTNGGQLYTATLKPTDTLGTTAMPFYRIYTTLDATTTNTASKLVLRDASGNFSAGTITAALSGNATTATTLATSRTFQTNLASTSTASFNGSANVTPGVTGTLPVGNGGTGATTLTGILKGNGTSAFTAATAGTDFVAPGGALGTPSSGTLTNCTGLPLAGLAAAAYATAETASTLAQRDANGNLTAENFISAVQSTATAAGTTTLTIGSAGTQVFTGTTTQTVKLPTTSVLAGMSYTIVNNSTGAVTVQSSAANTITVQAAGRVGVYTAMVNTPTTDAHWVGQTLAAGKVFKATNDLTLSGTDGTTFTFPTASGTVLTADSTATLSNKNFTGTGNTWPTFNQNTTGSAATLTTSRTFQTNLASTATASFNGSANVTPGVTGTLPVGNGGTGATTLTGILKGNGTSAFTAATAGTDYLAPGGALGTPASGTLTNCTGLPVSGLVNSTTEVQGLGSIELGHASDTTISRSAAGVIAVEGNPVMMARPRVATTASSATPSINCDTTDLYTITALAAAVTSVTVTGTPSDGQKLMIRIKDNGTARAITWGSSFVSSGAARLLTSTVAGKTHHLSFIYDSVAVKWVCTACDYVGY